jgi:hypothetical protein
MKDAEDNHDDKSSSNQSSLVAKIKNNNGLEKFLENDKKILTFNAIWREFGDEDEPSKFLLCYYL